MATLCPKHAVEYNKWKQCRLCLREHKKKYESTEKAKMARKERNRRYRHTPEGRMKHRAVSSVYKAILSGRLIKQSCIVCANPKTEAHHAWGYAEENKLRVVFLCNEHHNLADDNPEFNETLKSGFPPCA
jgi:hypothetical protein